ncbi:MAG TPA: response regulator [Alphaproteobacteria bacterium]|nr:response regulator [Rhodospirillaceae bacterium]HRJ12962.1 response regulator [Alphaproteobacteria bacterium]
MPRHAENVIPFARKQNRPLTVLAVDDDRLERALLEAYVSDLGHVTIQAENGAEALRILQEGNEPVDVILMDRMMPVLDGLSAVRNIKDDPVLRKIPIVMVTAVSNTKAIQEGLEAGVFYYLTKPIEAGMLRSVLIAATREAQQNRTLSDELRKHRLSFNMIHTCKFHFRTIAEAECLAGFMAHCFPDPERVLPGMAELLINAVEHGNLEIGYQFKTELLEHNNWNNEILLRQESPKYQDKVVEAVVTQKEDGIYLIITDEGQGFDWQRYMTIDPSRAGDTHGRGIAQAKAISFDKLTYNEKGNQVIAFVSKKKSLEW